MRREGTAPLSATPGRLRAAPGPCPSPCPVPCSEATPTVQLGHNELATVLVVLQVYDHEVVPDGHEGEVVEAFIWNGQRRSLGGAREPPPLAQPRPPRPAGLPGQL